jgi:ADP-ribosyl-[dinitrogen reductase] hydrolase
MIALAGGQPDAHRAMGLLVGAAVGDALGAPFEFGLPGEYEQRFPEPIIGGIGEMVGGGDFGWAPGEFTDDTQMALALAESLVARGGFDPDDVWKRWRGWALTAVDIGSTTRTALGFDDWRDVSHPDPQRTAANGALMRVFPLALLPGSESEIRDIVLRQASLTHPHPAAGWGAWLGVVAMRAGLADHDPFADLEAALRTLPEEVAPRYREMLAADWTPDRKGPGNGSIWGCLAQAIWAVRGARDFEDAVVRAIQLGGDTDTVACVAGAIAGARGGMQEIPMRWATYVHGRLTDPAGPASYDLSRLQDLARRLIRKPAQPESPAETPAGPSEVAPGLHAANLEGATSAPTEWGVVSLCRTGDRFSGHPVRRQAYMVDREGHESNPVLAHAVTEAVDAVDAMLADGLSVVVHCRSGVSRTGLVLKAWKMRRDGVTERDAHEWLCARWPLYSDYRRPFIEVLRQLGQEWGQ